MKKKSANIFLGKKILVYGLGRTGISSYKFLKKKAAVYLFDDNPEIVRKINKKCISLKELKRIKFDKIIISPGIDISNCKLSNFLKKNFLKIYTDLDIFYSFFKNDCFTITGTNGKSTTCQILYNIFKSNNLDVRLVGNIGKPMLLESKIKSKTIFIIEASSYQISYSKFFKTDHAVILNLSPDHLERHGNINKYAQAKLKLIFNQDKNTQSYIEKNNHIINKNIFKKKIKSILNKLNFNKEEYFKKKINNLYLLDKNNLKNIHFVYSICKKFRIPNSKIFNSLNKFKGLKFRKQIIYQKNNLTVINDSKSTSFSSTTGLLYSYKNIFWIVGGQFKKGDKFNIKNKYYKNIKAYIIGLNKKFFSNQFKDKIKFKCFGKLKDAIVAIKKDIEDEKSIKTILFSPSAASFDQYINFEKRGEHFNKTFKKIFF